MKKKLLLSATVVTISLMGTVLYFLYNNTSVLRTTDSEAIKLNNQGSPISNTSLDLNTLYEKSIIVDDENMKGVFSEERSLMMPENVSVQVYSAGFEKLRGIAFDNESNAWVVDQDAGELLVLVDENHNGDLDKKILVDNTLSGPHGVEYYLGDIYVGEKNKITVYRDITSAGTYSTKEILVDQLPDVGHTTKTVRIGPDEKMYVSIGSSCNICEEDDERRAAIVRYNLDGSDYELFAEGLRNTVDFQFYGGDIWGVNNGRDKIGDDIPPEEVNIIEQGKHYGWPYCYGQGVVSPEYPEKESFCTNESTYSTYDMQAHSAPLGMAFYPSFSNFPEVFRENMFVAFHGSWNRTIPTGYKIVRIDTFDPDAEAINFITGWLDSDSGEAWGRPVDIKFDRNGDMFITDDKANAVYKVTYDQI